MAVENLLFVGFNGRVVAMDQQHGELVWSWKCPKPSRDMIALLIENGCVFVSSSGYTYALDALTGEQLWFNPLSGIGTGVPCLATSASSSMKSFLLHAQDLANQRAASQAAHTSSQP